jgi:hypothetical protein
VHAQMMENLLNAITIWELQRVYRIIDVEGGLYLRFIVEEMINLNFVQDSFFLIPCAYQLRASLCLKLSIFTKQLAIYLHWHT